jgi:hypothetical protein
MWPSHCGSRWQRSLARHVSLLLAMSILELAAAAQVLKHQQAGLQKSRAAAKRRLAAEQPRPCTPWMRAVSMRLLALPDSGPDVVQEYLSKKKRRETVADVQGWYDTLAAAGTEQLLAPGGDICSERQLAEARRFCEESNLVRWVRQHNEENGVAPSASAVLDRAGPSLARQKWRRNRFRWVQRVLGRRGGRRINFAGRPDQLSTEDFERKVLPLFEQSSQARDRI